MPSANITREEALHRTEIVTARTHDVFVDLTGREVPDPERQFLSTTKFAFDSRTGETHVDLIADEVRAATLDGEQLDLSTFDGYRIPLALEEGAHELEITSVMRYSRSGEGLHRFVDTDDLVYLYSQFETADARRMYATFEQPDQKSTFRLTVEAPLEWLVLSNSEQVKPEDIGDGFGRWVFEPTKLLSSYLTALVAGPYHVEQATIQSVDGEVPASVACRQSVKEFMDHERIIETTQRGFEVFEEAFGVPYAFGTYDQVFVPEFNFGAMENAGCVIFRDEYLFRSRVTQREMEARDNTILHELAHMWFGDLVTMQWWDDLWLNESFAEWASHFANDEMAKRQNEDVHPWVTFANERKAWAYLQDQYPTTHPIASDSSDLEKVEQNFDGITYAKGASVLKLLVSFVGQDAFLAGVREYFKKHAYGNTVLQDLLVELEASSGKDLSWFIDQWLETAGVNTLHADFDVDDDGKFTRFDVVQSAHPDWPTLRKHRLGIGIYADGERIEYVESDVSDERTAIDELVGKSRGDIVLLNDGDLTFAKIRFDEESLEALRTPLSDPLARAVTWTSLWDMTRDGELAPQAYLELVLAGLPTETDTAGITTLLNQVGAAATSYTAPELRDQANAKLVAGLARLLRDAEPGSDKQVLLAKGLITAASAEAAIELIRGWLNDEEVPSGLKIDTAMRWAIVNTLAKRGVMTAEEIEAEREVHDNTSAGAEQAAGARAALPSAEEKERAWLLATEEPELPNETHRKVSMGFWQHGQDFDYTQQYLELLGKISNREGSWAERGYAAVAAVVKWLFPFTIIDEELVSRISAWMDEHQPNQQVTRLVTERLDDARRALRGQQASLRHGQPTNGRTQER